MLLGLRGVRELDDGGREQRAGVLIECGQECRSNGVKVVRRLPEVALVGGEAGVKGGDDCGPEGGSFGSGGGVAGDFNGVGQDVAVVIGDEGLRRS